MDASKLILVVDDEQSIRRNIEKMLVKAGYGVVTASSYLDAIEKLEQYRFDLIVLDIRMPNWTGELSEEAGVDLLKQEVFEKQSHKPPVIMLTASEDVELAVESMKYGAIDFIRKSKVSPKEFNKIIQKALGIAEENVDTLKRDKKLPQNNPNVEELGQEDHQYNFQTRSSSGTKTWFMARTEGILDEIIAGVILTGILYMVGLLFGVLEGTPLGWLSDYQSIWYLVVSLVLMAIIIIVYVAWQHKRRR
jgi:FixJ family two-component response regulator